MRPLCRVCPFPGVKLRISRRNGAGGDPEHGMKRGHRVKPTIEAEHVFIEVRLQMFWLDTPMMCPLDPGLQVAEDEMDHGQVRLCLVGIAAKRQSDMAVSYLGQSWVAGPPIGADGSAKRDGLFDKAGKSFSAPVRDDAKPQASCINAALVRLTVILTRPNLNGTDYGRLVVRSTAFSARLATDIALINFDPMLTADEIAFGTNHTSTEFVEYLEGRLIAGERKLALELHGGLARYLCGHEVCTPKPCRERRMAGLHDRASRKRCVGLAAAAAQYHRRAGLKAIRLLYKSTFRACKPAWPTHGLKEAGTSVIIGKHPLKLWKGSRESSWVHICENSSS
jgi:hypothetical protein